MKFQPFGSRYDFSKGVLIKNFPDYMRTTIENWLWKLLKGVYVAKMSEHYLTRGRRYLESSFLNDMQIQFREVFPQLWNEAIRFIFLDQDRTANFLALCLQNYAKAEHASELERILSQSGSGYEVTKTVKGASEYSRGVYDLVERVSPVVKEQSEKALSDNAILEEAWKYCYSRNPDYDKVVSKSCDFLEGFLGKRYFPKDPKPQLKKFVHAFEQTPELLSYNGDSIVNPKSNLTSLLKEASNIRGQHTAGKGRQPTKEEAEFVLHTTILIWNMHQK